ncbi:MAG: hypothetical protein PHY48_09460, partial [Candidatus Cloacimonetes bacterium]|nr:hypothetical protein [Candidatus Cloacimonadota bacterium]
MKAYAKTLLVSIVLLLCAQIAAQTNIDLVCNSMYSWQSWTNIATKDDQAYAVGTGPSMYLLDLSDSNHPQYNGVFNTPGTYAVKDIEIVGNTTILFQDGRVHWVDISIPNYPELTASVSFTGQYSWKAISESHAYVINRQGELYCYNFADPFTPVLTDSLYLGGTSNYAKIGILGNRAYVSGL